MKIKGTVISGPMRGAPLVHHHFPRLIGLLGFRPYEGTLDVRLEGKLDIKLLPHKNLEYRMQDGFVHVDACVARIKIRKVTKAEPALRMREQQKETLQTLDEIIESVGLEKTVTEPGYECYAVQFQGDQKDEGVIEIIGKDFIKKKLDLEDGDKITIEFLDDEK